MDNLLMSRVITDALSKLGKSIPPGSKKPRTKKELANFLEQVRGILNPFNIPVPAASICTMSDPPKGLAWAVKVAMVNEDRDFHAFAKKHGQRDVYLAAIALSSPENDDHGEIRAIEAAIHLWEKSSLSVRQSLIAEQQRSPFVALILSILKNHPEETVEGIWTKLINYIGEEFDFNGEATSISMKFKGVKPEKSSKSKDCRLVEWCSLDAKLTGRENKPFLRRSLNPLISKLRHDFRIPKCR